MVKLINQNINKQINNKYIVGAGEMGQRLRAQAPLQKDPDGTPSTHRAAHNSVTPVTVELSLLVASSGMHMHWNTHTQTHSVTDTYTLIHTYSNTHIHTQIYTHTHTHKHTHTYTYTQIVQS